MGKAALNCYNLAMDATNPSQTILHADPEHQGLRNSIIVILIFGVIIGFFVIRALILWLGAGSLISEFAFFLSCMGSILLALGLTFGFEALLKRRWHSGIDVVIDADQVELTFEKRPSSQPQPNNQAVIWANRINQTCYYFPLNDYSRSGREKRLSDKWFCFVCELHQDDNRINVFAYLSPAQANIWTADDSLMEPFHKINQKTLYADKSRFRFGPPTRPEIPNEILTGKDGRFWLAERRRWQRGVELTAVDFETFMQTVKNKTKEQG